MASQSKIVGKLICTISFILNIRVLGFFVVNDGALVNFCNLQIMDYVLCHFIPL
jgi:hypothetical protein